MENEHSTYSVKGGASGGSVAADFVHKAGSAKAYYDASEPTVRPDGSTALGTEDAGRLWVDSDDEAPYVWTGTAWELLDPVTNLSGKALTPASVAATGAVSGSTITGTGIVTGSGGFTSGDVVVKFKKFTGTTAAASNETSFLHGLGNSKILGAFILVNYNGTANYWATPDTTNNTTMVYIPGTTFTFYHPGSSSYQGRTYKVTIFYEA